MTSSFPDELETAISHRDADRICNLMFIDSGRSIRSGAGSERELWDYKRNIPSPRRSKDQAWSDIAADLLAMHNGRGGVLIFGVADDFRCEGTREVVDSKEFNDKVRKYLGDKIWIDYNRAFIREDQTYIGIAIVRPRGPLMARFQEDAPRPTDSSKPKFLKGWSALRNGDSTEILNHASTARHSRSLAVPVRGEPFAVDEPFYRLLAPDYSYFVKREELCELTMRALRDPRTSVAALLGVGGMGKNCTRHLGRARSLRIVKFRLYCLDNRERPGAVICRNRQSGPPADHVRKPT